MKKIITILFILVAGIARSQVLEKTTNSKEIVIQPEKTLTVTTFQIRQFTDDGVSIVALVAFGDKTQINQPTEVITLWEGKDYKKPGEYTEQDLIDRVDEILTLRIKK